MIGGTEILGQVYVDLTNLDIYNGYSGKFALADLVSHPLCIQLDRKTLLENLSDSQSIVNYFLVSEFNITEL